MKYFRRENAQSAPVAPPSAEGPSLGCEVWPRSPSRLSNDRVNSLDGSASVGHLSASDIEAIGDLGHQDDEIQQDGEDMAAADGAALNETTDLFCADRRAQRVGPTSTSSKARYLSRRIEQLWQEMENADRAARFRLDRYPPLARAESPASVPQVRPSHSSMHGPKCRSCGAELDGSYPAFCRSCGDAQAIHRARALRTEPEREPRAKRNRLDACEGFDDPIDRFAASVFADEASQASDDVPAVEERSSHHAKVSVGQILLLFVLFVVSMAVASQLCEFESFSSTLVEEPSHAAR